MLNLGLTYAEQKELALLLRTSHRLRTSLWLMDLDHNYLGSLSTAFLGGSVTIDVTSDVTRSLSLDLFDISRSINIVPDDPDGGAAYPTRMIQAIYCVGRPDGTKWYNIPVFTGPVIKADRDGAVLHVECQGKEVLSSSALWTAKTYNPRWNKMSLLRTIMSSLSGETRFDLARSSATTSKKTVLARGGNGPWLWAKSIANSMGMQAFYDGRGYLRVRARPSTVNWVFDDSFLKPEDPQVSFSLGDFYNAVEITGGTPKGKKKPVTYRVVADASHPLSPVSLGRAGVPRYVPHVEQNSDLLTTAACKSFAETRLREGLLQAIDATFEAMTIPHLEEDDLLSLRTGHVVTDFRLKQTTIPLLCNDYMSVGYTKPVKPSKLTRRLRRA